MECPSLSLPRNSMLAESCNSTYQSMCDLQCEEGFNGSGDPSHVCDVLSDGSSAMWMTGGGGWSCERGIYFIILNMKFTCVLWMYEYKLNYCGLSTCYELRVFKHCINQLKDLGHMRYCIPEN